MPLLSRPEVGGLPALLDRPDVSGLLVISPIMSQLYYTGLRSVAYQLFPPIHPTTCSLIAHIIIIIQLCRQSNSARIYQAIPIIQAQCQQSNAISFNSISRVVSGLTYPQGSPPYKRKVLLASRHVQTRCHVVSCVFHMIEIWLGWPNITAKTCWHVYKGYLNCLLLSSVLYK